MLAEAEERNRLVREAHATLDRIRERDEPGRGLVHADVGDLRVENLLDLVADDVIDRLQLELAGERRLNPVDQRELGVPLPRLVHEAGVVEGHAEAARERGQEALVRLGEGVCPVEVLERDHPGRTTANHEWDEQQRTGRLATQHLGIPVSLEDLRRAVGDQQRFLRLQHVLAEADQRDRLVGEAHTALDRVRVRDKP